MKKVIISLLVLLSLQQAFAGIFGDKNQRKVPRFVSLRSDKVNARVGPAKKYPIRWVFVRKNYPLKVIREFDTWRLVKDVDGAEGWIHQSLLSGLRTVVVQNKKGDFAVLMDRPTLKKHRIVANVENGAVLKVLKQKDGYVYVMSQDGKYKGWLKDDVCWGARL